jgi:hypothetical protein
MAKVRVNGAILSGKEATQRSSLRLGAYEALYQVAAKHGPPFQNTDSLPVEYNHIHPRHNDIDGIKWATELKQERHEIEERNARMAEREGGSASEVESSSESKSVESIPEGFISPGESGDEDDLNVYDGDGEGTGHGRWEDPDGETSSNEGGDMELEEEESGEASDNDSIDEEGSDSDGSGIVEQD